MKIEEIATFSWLFAPDTITSLGKKTGEDYHKISHLLYRLSGDLWQKPGDKDWWITNLVMDTPAVITPASFNGHVKMVRRW